MKPKTFGYKSTENLHKQNPKKEIQDSKPKPISSRRDSAKIVCTKMGQYKRCNICPDEMKRRKIHHMFEVYEKKEKAQKSVSEFDKKKKKK